MGKPFIGFSFNGVHSSELGIVRVSDGSRYNENLLPTLQDKTVQVPGGDGQYYFGSNYGAKQFSISFAFDNMTKENLRELKKTFGTKDLGRLIFDEASDRYYMAKVSGTPTLKFICFEETVGGQKVDIYKGEGTVQFSCYYPFAKSKNTHSLAPTKGNSGIEGTNNGDLSADWVAYYPLTIASDISILISNSEKTSCTIRITKPEAKQWGEKEKEKDTYISVNSKTNLIEGWTGELNASTDTLVRSGNLYNEYLTSGSFAGLPTGQFTFNGGADLARLEYQDIYY